MLMKSERKSTKAALKRNGLVWCDGNHSVAAGHEKSGFNAKNAIIGLTVSAHQGDSIVLSPLPEILYYYQTYRG